MTNFEHYLGCTIDQLIVKHAKQSISHISTINTTILKITEKYWGASSNIYNNEEDAVVDTIKWFKEEHDK